MRFSILKGIVRGAFRDRLLTSINLVGLVAGLTASILILSFSLEEYATDEFHEDVDRIYRIDAVVTTDGETSRWADTPFRLLEEIESSFPGAEAGTRMYPTVGVVRMGDVVEYQSFTYVDPGFLDLFSFELVSGSPESALDDPGSIVLTESVADRYFPRDGALGRTLEVKIGDSFRSATVSGVIRDAPQASSIRFQALLPASAAVPEAVRPDYYERWRGQTGTFVRLDPATDPAAFADRLSTLQDIYGDVLLDGRESFDLALTRLTDVYFDQAALTRGITESSSPRTANALIGLALLILGIAVANFTTLSIARSTKHTRAVGIRKAIGASRLEIAREYLTDSLVKAVFAALVAVGLAELLADPFSTITGTVVDPSILAKPSYLLVLGGIILGTGFLSGFYPAMHLSAIRPIGVLHGDRIRLKTSRVIRGVVLLQFVATGILLIAAWTISKQVRYLNNLDDGLSAENVLVVEPDFTNSSTVPAVYGALAGAPPASIESVARSAGMIGRSFGSMDIETDDGTERAHLFGITDEYLDLLGIELVAGEPVDPSRPNELLVNRPFVERLGLDPEQAVGVPVGDSHRIAGVLEDFYHHNVRSELRPLALYPITPDQAGGYLLVRAAPERGADATEFLRQTWREVAPDVPMRTYWLDADLADQAGSAARWNRVMRMSTIFAIMIASLGLFGLSALAADRRTKEVGIRKVLGAGPIRVTGLLVRETAVLAVIAALVAVPVGAAIMQGWLEDFANRIVLQPGELAGLAALLVLIAVAAVSVQSMRAALADPIDSLRHE